MPHKLATADCFATGCTQWYTLFNQPSAQCRDGKTYIVYPGANLDPLVVCYDHAGRRWSGPVRAGENPLVNDDHGNPSMLIDAAGFIHVFYGCHAGPMKYAKSAKPLDISSFTKMPDPAAKATYPQVMQMSDGTMCLFYRAGAHCDDWVLRTSADGGANWGEAQALIKGVPPQDAWYAGFAKGPGDTVHAGFVWKDDNNALRSPGPEYVHRYDLYYMRRDARGLWRNASGEELKLPVAKAAARAKCRVYDSIANKQHTGGCSVGVDGSGEVHLLFRVGGYFGDTRYEHKLATWSGREWEFVNIGPAIDCGFADYPRDDNFSLQVEPKLLRAYVANILADTPATANLEQWESADAGRTWTKAKTIFTSSDIPPRYVLIAPKPVLDHHPDAAVVFGATNRCLYGQGGFVPASQPSRP